MLRISPLLVLVMTMIPAIGAQVRGPRVRLSEQMWNFGEHTQGELVTSKIIKVTNTGDEDLKLDKVDVTCGCVIPRLEVKLLPPGAETDLVLELDTRRGEGGIIDKQVTLTTNDPTQRTVAIPTRGVIHRVWWLKTRNINIGTIKNGLETVRRFQIFVRKGHDVKLKAITSSTDEIKLTKTPFEEEDGTRGWTIAATFDPRMESLDHWEGQVLFESNFAPIPLIGVRLFGTIAGSISISPRRLVFGTMDPGESRTLEFVVKKTVGTGMDIANLHCVDQQISMKSSEVVKGREYKVQVTLKAVAEGSVRGRIHAAVNEPGQKVHVVEYTARVRK